MEDHYDYISPILCGGLGNNLFQIAATLSYAKDKNYKAKFGYWTSYNSKLKLPIDHISTHAGLPNPYFRQWGGWITKDPSVTISRIFPKLKWFNNPDPTSDGEFNTVNEEYKWGFELDTGSGGEYQPLDINPGTQFYGYFFNHRYWHHNRNYIIKKLEFNKTDLEYVKNKYAYLIEQGPVSINVRVQDLNFPAEQEMFYRADYINQVEFIKDAMRVFGTSRKYVFTSNNVEYTRDILATDPHFKRYDCTVIDEDFHYQLMLCSLCKDHILTNSTFSFWCCYLNKNIEESRVVYQSNFVQEHSTEMIPYKWISLEKRLNEK